MDLKLDMGMSFMRKNTDDNVDEVLHDVAIIGSGPAGLSAALYAKRKGLKTIVVSDKSGGQVVDTTSVENYLGIEFETGSGLAERFSKHVESLNVTVLRDATVNQLEKHQDLFSVILSSGKIINAKALIIATGSKPRKLGVIGEEAFSGRGVAYCAICDGPLFEGLDVVVAGGGNSAVEAALDLSKIANSVTLVHRSVLRADQIVIDQLEKQQNVRVHLNTQIKEIYGQQLVEGIKVHDKTKGEDFDILANGVFVEIGYLPNNQLVTALLKLNDRGEIIVNSLNETSVPGVFAAGDVTDTPYKQIVVAASEGAKAALSANDYINRKN